MMILRASILIYLVGMISSDPPPYKLIDMTHTFNNMTIHWPDDRKFELRITEKGTQRGFWLQLEEDSSATDAGTHMDSPCMYVSGRWCVDQIPLKRYIAKAAVIDITRQAEANRDYGATIQDLQDWERKNHQSLNGMIIVLKSGWEKRWGDAHSFLGTTDFDLDHLHYPGISPQAAKWLVDNRDIIGVGDETLSVGVGQDNKYNAQRILHEANIYALSSMANVDKLPAYGATLHVLPMKIGGAAAAPIRIIAAVH